VEGEAPEVLSENFSILQGGSHLGQWRRARKWLLRVGLEFRREEKEIKG
jgi:hypothetical protein